MARNDNNPTLKGELPSIETNPGRFLKTWKELSDLYRMENPKKVRGVKIWAHDIQARIESEGYAWTNLAGEPLRGGKLTRFLTRMKTALILNLQRYEDADAARAFKIVNGQGQPGNKGYIRKMFVNIMEVVPIMPSGSDDDWSVFKEAMKFPVGFDAYIEAQADGDEATAQEEIAAAEALNKANE